jgi:hypothetical protein
MELAQLTVDRITVMASMTFPGSKKLSCLFGTFRLNAPFFCARHDHRGVEGLEFGFRLCGLRHVGTFERITMEVGF